MVRPYRKKPQPSKREASSTGTTRRALFDKLITPFTFIGKAIREEALPKLKPRDISRRRMLFWGGVTGLAYAFRKPLVRTIISFFGTKKKHEVHLAFGRHAGEGNAQAYITLLQNQYKEKKPFHFIGLELTTHKTKAEVHTMEMKIESLRKRLKENVKKLQQQGKSNAEIIQMIAKQVPEVSGPTQQFFIAEIIAASALYDAKIKFIEYYTAEEQKSMKERYAKSIAFAKEVSSKSIAQSIELQREMLQSIDEHYLAREKVMQRGIQEILQNEKMPTKMLAIMGGLHERLGIKFAREIKDISHTASKVHSEINTEHIPARFASASDLDVARNWLERQGNIYFEYFNPGKSLDSEFVKRARNATWEDIQKIDEWNKGQRQEIKVQLIYEYFKYRKK
jgi:hypothetical protein